MIDDKKIETAKEEIYEDKFLGCGEMVEAFEDEDNMEMFDKEDIKEAIGLGAKWMQEEFLKDLWHPASEEPVEDKPFLAQEIGRWRVGVNSPLIPNNEWSTQRKIRGIKRWLYVEDLLPKTQKGGNHD